MMINEKLKMKKLSIISYQLLIINFMSRDGDSNPGPTPYHGVALPAELSRHEDENLPYQFKLHRHE